MVQANISLDEDKRLIQSAYRQLLRSIKSKLDEDDKRSIRKAYEIAVQAHSTQRRKSGEPYILHPIAVARICAEEIGLGPTAVVCALLHDVVEDTDVTLDEIRLEFGEKIARIVDGLTKLDRTYSAESPQAENFKKVLSTLVDDVRVVLIKMADRLHNMRTLGSMSRNSQLKIAAETSYIYAPLAHRLGLYNIKTEFQDLCMKITDPDEYKKVAKKLAETKKSREQYINEFIEPLKKKLDEAKIKCEVYGRPKSIYSIWNKLNSKKVPLEEIYDLFAIRIVIDAPPDKEKLRCWQAYSIVTDVHRPIAERLKDWITMPKANGYESLHTTVVGPDGRYVEVQIRTQRMDEIAERGFAAHWKYKGVSSNQNVFDRWLESVREMLDDPNSGDSIEFLADFRNSNLFQEEIYVYTPKGDVKVLPKGATALDFAFSIHTDVGYHCSAIKVNNKLVPMSAKLEHGDQVQVITNKNQKPSEDWLKMVSTGKAKAKIRSVVKEERKRVGELGKEALERKLRNLKVDFDESVETLLKYYNLASKVDLFFMIATDQKPIVEIFKKFKTEAGRLVEIEQEPVKELIKEAPQEIVRKANGKARLMIQGEPAERYEFSFATCCNPVQGDDIFAYLTATAGLKIHRANCNNAKHLMAYYGYRVMKAEWVVTEDVNFVAELKIIGVDAGIGVIEKISHVISSNLGLNMRKFNIEGDDGYFEANIKVVVTNTNQLNKAITELENLEYVSSVTRMV
jgi:GTP diphosphokinase / guanosine-3',5'-bis(diphosphate) 3'-diphosphatase